MKYKVFLAESLMRSPVTSGAFFRMTTELFASIPHFPRFLKFPILVMDKLGLVIAACNGSRRMRPAALPSPTATAAS